MDTKTRFDGRQDFVAAVASVKNPIAQNSGASALDLNFSYRAPVPVVQAK
ncbi:hypothetical protein QUB60_15790 [Microcoleus sp. A2-C5]